jgi:hypothetical protein
MWYYEPNVPYSFSEERYTFKVFFSWPARTDRRLVSSSPDWNQMFGGLAMVSALVWVMIFLVLQLPRVLLLEEDVPVLPLP